MSRVERFKSRREKFVKTSVVKNQGANRKDFMSIYVEEIYDFHKQEDIEFHFVVSNEEAEEFLEKFKKDFTQEKFDKLIVDIKNTTIQSIVVPFGLGKFISAYDKTGGNVDTVSNARQDIYATDKEKKAHEDRGEFDSDKYHKDELYKQRNKEVSEARERGEATDYMTGGKIGLNDKYDLDHVISAKEVHDDPGRVLAEIDGPDLANKKENLKPTNPTLNRSKKADTATEFSEKIKERTKELDKLKSKENLTDKEMKEIEKLETLNKVDHEELKRIDKEIRDEYNKEINIKYYASKKFAFNTIATSGIEAGKMGLQQALGAVVVELLAACMDEAMDIYTNGFYGGFDEKKFMSVLIQRLEKIGKRIMDKWQDFLISFKDGAIAGFISNLTTTFINIFATTAKRLVSIIREGIFSLYRAIKMLMFPTEGMNI